MDVFHLRTNMWDSEIQNELGTKDYRSVEEVVASMISRIMMWKDKVDGHQLLTNNYANIEHARAADGRIVAVDCNFDGSEWFFDCNELDEGGDWDGGSQFSSPAIGA
jgi:bifunctional pyridoxal-dependent enzyme with beta-cystathionase and maltose regulon repressor activities